MIRSINLLYLIVSTALLGIYGLYDGGIIAPVVLNIIIFIGATILTTPREMSVFRRVYLVGVIFTCLLYTVYTYRYGTPYFVGGSDDLLYEKHARRVVQQLGWFEYFSIRGEIVGPHHNSVGYIYFLSIIYRLAEVIGDFTTLVPRIINVSLLSYSSVLVYRISRRYVSLKEATSFYCGIAVGLYPIMIWTSAHTFRDILVSFSILYVLYKVWTKEFRLIYVPLLVVSVLALSEIRLMGAAFILMMVPLIYAKRVVTRSSWRGVVGLALAGLVLFYISVEWYNYQSLFRRLVTLYEGYTRYRGHEMSSGLARYIFLSPEPYTYVLRLIFMIGFPIPVPSLDIVDSWLMLGTLVQLICIPLLAFGVMSSTTDWRTLEVAIIFLILYAGVAIFSFQYRHITMFYPYAVIMAGVGYERLQADRALKIWMLSSYLVVVFVIGVYILYRIGLLQ